MPAPNVAISPVTPVAIPTNGGTDGASGSSATSETGFAAVLGQQAAALTVTGNHPMRGSGSGAETQEGALAMLTPLLIGNVQSSRNSLEALEGTDDLPDSEMDLAALLLAIPGGMAQIPGYGMPVTKGHHETLLPSQATGTVETATESMLAKSTSDLAVPGTDQFPKTMATAAGNQSSRATTADAPAIVAALQDLNSDVRVESIATKSIDILGASGRELSAPTLATAAPIAQVMESRSPVVVKAIETPVGTSGWDGEIGGRIVWMTSHQQNRAELTLTPPQFGRIEISLSLSGDQANAFFVSANPAVRDALEAALPRLREVLADAGIALGQAQVGSESLGQRRSSDDPTPGRVTTIAGEGLLTASASSGNANWLKTGRGLVDVFA